MAGTAVLVVSATALGQPAGKGAGAAPGSGTGAASAQAAGVDVQRAELEKHFTAGVDYASKKQWKKAVEELKLAYGLSPLPQIAGNLGEAELEIGAYRDAAEHVEKYLREEKASEIKPADRKAAEGWLAKAKKNVATLKITVTVSGGAPGKVPVPEGVEVLVDDAPLKLSPFPPEVYVAPGKHTIVARKGNARDEIWGEFPVGTAQDVRLELKETAAPGPTATAGATGTGPTGTASSTPFPVRTVTLVGGGIVTGAAIFAGVALAIASDQKIAGVEEARVGLTDGQCAGAAQNDACQRLMSVVNERNALATGSLWSFIGAAAAGGATAAYWALSPKRADAKNAPVHAGMMVLPAGGGLLVHGAW